MFPSFFSFVPSLLDNSINRYINHKRLLSVTRVLSVMAEFTLKDEFSFPWIPPLFGKKCANCSNVEENTKIKLGVN